MDGNVDRKCEFVRRSGRRCRQFRSIIGHCDYCDLDFCTKHRLPESHDCSAMDKVMKDAFDKNKEREDERVKRTIDF